MRFQRRDGEILHFIQANDGVVSLAQLHRRFWPGKTLRAVQKRLQKLCEAGYLARPTRQQYRTTPIPEAVVWLEWRGILYIAGRSGVPVEPPKNPEVKHQRKELARELRNHDIRWVRTPRWGKLQHDLKVIDFRLRVEEAAASLSWMTLEEWVTESAFRVDMDTVTYSVRGKGGVREQKERGVVPDGYFAIANDRRRVRGETFLARYLLEMDMATHSNPAFARDKAAPYAAYIESPEYKARFGANAGRWLVVATGEQRRDNLLRQTELSVGEAAGHFYFTTMAEVEEGDVLIDPIWRVVGREASASLLALSGTL